LVLTLPAAREELERYLLAWVQTQVSEGLSLLKKERAFNEIDEAIGYVNGEQFPLRSRAISRVVDNRLRKIALETCSSLTDVRPIWNYNTYNEQYKDQSLILNKLARGWWKNSAADRRLQSTLMFSCVGGSGYAALSWNPALPGGGDVELIPFDPRDVVPIEPIYSDSIQDWRGVILRQKVPVSQLRHMFPSKAHLIQGTGASWFGTKTKEGQTNMYSISSPAWNLLTKGQERLGSSQDGTDLIHIYIKDDSINTGADCVLMGDPGTNWSYNVYPVGSTHPDDGHRVTEQEARLYPRGRLILCTTEAILKDGPNPYWHGLFPLVRFTLDPLPWSLLGGSMIGDLVPLQNSLNEGLRGLEDGMSQWIRRGVIADSKSIGKPNLDAIDTRKSGMKVLLNPTMGEGFKVVDGPEFPQWYMDMIEFYKSEMDEISGVRGLQQLAQLKQMPSADTLEKYMDALSPLLRLRARSIEVSLGEMAEMLKVCFFQYYDTDRRMQILGPDGVSLEDFDYDPGNLVPSHVPGNTREERASAHHRNFTFSVAPNSFLNVSHTTQKMFVLQLLRANLMDPWTAWDAFDLPNVGQAPAETIPERMVAARKLGLQPGPTPEMVQMQQMAMMAQLGQIAAQAQLGGGLGGGQSGQMGLDAVPEAPATNGTGPAGGRPPSGNQPPSFQMKDGGSRQVISESGS
jgi:hypothetical protein